MNTKVFLNAVRLGRIGLVWYAIGIMLPILSGTLGQSAMQDQGAALGKIIEGLPPAVLAMFKINLSSFSSPIGYMCARGLSLLWPIVVIAFAAGSAGGISSMLERGTIHFELSLPVSRTQWFLSRILAGLLGLVLLMLVTLAVLSISVPAEWWRFMMLGLAFGILWLGVGFAVAAFARDRGLVTGVVFGLFGLQFLLATLASTISGAGWLGNLSTWTNYTPETVMNDGVPWGTVALWTALGVFGFGLALWRWRTRDIPA
jgi:ABC-type transport system involved in multi-copper enzyme maturation permease subunit